MTSNRATFIIFLTALILRLVMAFAPHDLSLLTDGQAPDMRDYYCLARAFSTNGIWIPAIRPPLYPLFLAAISWFAGTSLTTVILIQALLGAAVCCLVYSISLRLNGEKGALLSGLLVAVYPTLIIYTSLIMSENLFIFLLTLALWILIRAHPPDSRNAFMAGVILGLACLTRSILVAFSPLAALWIFASGKRLASLSCLLGTLIVVAPWTLRNYAYYHRPVLIDTYADYNFLVGNNPDARGCQDYDAIKKLARKYWPGWNGDDRLRAPIGYREGMRFIVSNPSGFLTLGLKKLGCLYGLETRELAFGYSRNYFGDVRRALLVPVSASILIGFPLICILATIGFAFPVSNARGSWSLLTLAILYFTTAHFLTFGESRFHLPLIPGLALFAGRLRAPHKSIPFNQKVLRVILGLLLLFLAGANWINCLSKESEKISAILKPGGNKAALEY